MVKNDFLKDRFDTIVKFFNMLKSKPGKMNEHQKQEIENEILIILNKFPSLLSFYARDTKKNIGMLAANFGFEKIVLLSLNNQVASTQQDINGFNIGMYAAKKGLEEATLLSLKNETASKQKNSSGKTILDLAYEFQANSLFEGLVSGNTNNHCFKNQKLLDLLTIYEHEMINLIKIEEEQNKKNSL